MRQIEEICGAVAAGERLGREEFLVLYRTGDFLDLGRLASLQRYRSNPEKTVTYLVDRNINYTNVCNTDCSFCAFYRSSPEHPEAYVNSKEVLSSKIEETLALGGTRILLQGGHNDALPYSYYVDLVSWIHEKYPIEINAFSPSEIQQMARISGKSYLAILTELQQAGLRGLPGGGAEILDDDIRKKISPKKTKSGEWIEVMEIAQSLSLTTTASMVIGFGESFEQRLNHLERLRDLQDRSKAKGLVGFNCFISWVAQLNENTSMGRSRHSVNYGSTAMEYMRNIALARIYLDNIQHHQASWPTMGPEVAQIGLAFGCDDFGSTMMEENVVSQAGGHTKDQWYMSPEELRNYIKSAGYRPAQRNTSFEIIKTFE
jgi:cyclic dehypoxanthinyl futalosine synthase